MPPELSPETAALKEALEAANRNIAALQADRQRERTTEGYRSQEVQLDGKIYEAQQQLAGHERAIAELNAEGKFEEAATATRQMSQTSAYLAQLHNQKGYVTQQREAAGRDPLQQYTPGQRAWIEKNPRYFSDPQFNARINAAANYAKDVLGHAPETREWWEAVENAAAGRSAQEAQPRSGGAADETPFSDTGDDIDHPPVQVSDTAPEQQHTRPAPPVGHTQDAPVMRIDVNPEPPGDAAPENRRAVGNGGGGMRSVAAPPSRNIKDAADRARNNRQIAPTPEEIDTARTLAESIEPELAARGDQDEIIRWYYALAKSPTHNHTRRRSWARDAIVG